MSIYDLSAVEKLIEHYRSEKNPQIIEVEEGVLGYGLTLLYADDCKLSVIKEVYLNSWSSGHTIRMYNKVPKKYLQYVL